MQAKSSSLYKMAHNSFSNVEIVSLPVLSKYYALHENHRDQFLERWYLMLGGVAVGRGFEPQSDLELSFAEILI
jgi:hypothetical protein